MWLPEDIEAALEWARAADSLCSGCGQPRDSSFDPDGPAYKVRELRCRACEVRDITASEWAKSNSSKAGLYLATEQHGRDVS